MMLNQSPDELLRDAEAQLKQAMARLQQDISTLRPVKILRDEYAMAALTGMTANANYNAVNNDILVKLVFELANEAMRQREQQLPGPLPPPLSPHASMKRP